MSQSLIAPFKLIRPAQWVKNVFVLAALVFGVQADAPDFTHKLFEALAAFGIFCMLSGAVYAFNDLLDYKEDALHPTKKHRPVASGAIAPAVAGVIAVGLAAAGAYASLQLAPGFALTAVGYLMLNLFYSLWAKRRALLDVIIISIGFVLRALAGAQAIEVEVSAWLVVCTFTLCLFLGFGKRRCELAVLGTNNEAARHRASLSEYSIELLSQLLSVSGAMAVITFLLYTLDPHTPTPRSLVFTTPLVFYAIFRYAMVIGRGDHTGPTDILIKDRPFLITAILWAAITLGLIFTRDLDDINRYLPKLRYPGSPPAIVAPSAAETRQSPGRSSG